MQYCVFVYFTLYSLFWNGQLWCMHFFSQFAASLSRDHHVATDRVPAPPPVPPPPVPPPPQPDYYGYYGYGSFLSIFAWFCLPSSVQLVDPVFDLDVWVNPDIEVSWNVACPAEDWFSVDRPANTLCLFGLIYYTDLFGVCCVCVCIGCILSLLIYTCQVLWCWSNITFHF